MFNFVPINDLNNAKKKISYLLRMKYIENNNEYTPTNATGNVNNQFMEVLKLLNNSNEYVIMAETSYSASGVDYFRSSGSYTQFVKSYSSLNNSIAQIKRILFEIINNIGYVKPENMQLFYDEYEKYKTNYKKFANTFFLNNKMRAVKAASNGTLFRDFEKDTVNNLYSSIDRENTQLNKFKNYFNDNYNYIEPETKTKKTTNTTYNTEKSNFDYNNDED